MSSSPTTILKQITYYLDDVLQAESWNLRYVAFVTAILLGLIHTTFGKRYGIEWTSLAHAIITAVGSAVCVYLDFIDDVVVTSESLTGISSEEPLRWCQCYGPLTSLHRILPAITMGYSLYDLYEGIRLGTTDFVLHGLATLFVMGFYTEHNNKSQFISPMLLMEVSTIFLACVRCEFFSSTASLINQLLFALNFLLFRLVIVPMLWLKIIIVMYEQSSNASYRSCFPYPYRSHSDVFTIF